MRSAAATAAPAALRLELRAGPGRPTLHDVTGAEYLLGSVPGCDLRLPGTHLPPIVALIAQQPDGVRLRKLAPSLPMTLNGQPVHHAPLADGDRIGIAGIELRVHLATDSYAPPPPPAAPEPFPEPAPIPEATAHAAHVAPRPPRGSMLRPINPAPRQPVYEDYYEPPVPPPPPPPPVSDRHLDAKARALADRERDLDGKARELEADRVLWYQRRAELEHEVQAQQAAADAAHADAHAAQEDARRAEAERATHEGELAKVRDELKGLKAELYARYQERRDRLAGLQQAVQVAARKVQERKHALDAELAEARPALARLTAGQADLERRRTALDAAERQHAAEAQQRADALAQREGQLIEREAALAAKERDAERDQQRRDAEARERETQLDADRRALEFSQTRHQAELVRLDRVGETLDGRDKQLSILQAEVDRKAEQLARDSRELEEQARQLDQWQTRQQAEAERLSALKVELDQAVFKQAERAATTEGQQTMLTSLRTKLERMRDDVRQQAGDLAEQRGRQEGMEHDLAQQRDHLDAVRQQVDADQQSVAAERRLFEQRSATLQDAVARMRDLQERLTAQEADVSLKAADHDRHAAEIAEQTASLKARAVQMLELQQKLDVDGKLLAEREAALAQAEATRLTMQEHLRKRGEELTAKGKALDAQGQTADARDAALAARIAAIESERATEQAEVAAHRAALTGQAATLDERQSAVATREATVARQAERLKEAGQSIAAERKTFFQAKARGETEQRQAHATLAAARADLELFHRDAHHQAAELQRTLPDLELRAQAATEQLGQAREQLRGHLAELHEYAQQTHEELIALRGQVQAEAERVRQGEVQLGRGRAEHRLAVTAFRQQLIDWQTRVAEMRRTLAHDETRLERREAEVTEAARQAEATSADLAQRSEALAAQQQAVSDRRGAVEQHLTELQEWYRRKLRELADSAGDGPHLHPGDSAADGELDPGDQMLGDQLRALDLVDADTLARLLREAARQRRSLRQALLASGHVTLYQLTAIENGHLDALALGRFRVLDRVAATAGEAVYRVFDPLAVDGGLRTLRHLAEGEAADAVRPDEFRQRFAAAAAAASHHPNLAATLDVLDIAGRPAAVQEWLAGLPSLDWPSLAAAPTVWFRLVTQAAVGLQAAHEAGLVHGHLTAKHVVLSPGGVVKLAGFGEPGWLVGTADADATPADDLAALGRVAAGWLDIPNRRKSAKPAKPLPDALKSVLDRLSPDAEQPISSAAELLDELDRAGADLPASNDAWERLVKYAGENATEGLAWRKSA